VKASCGESLDERDLLEALPALLVLPAVAAAALDLAVRVCVLPLKIDSSSFVSPSGLDGLKMSLGILGGRPLLASR